MKVFQTIVLLLFLAVPQFSIAQKIDNQIIRDKITAFKKDSKGPYQQIMWFCPDGSKVPPKQRCPEKGGVQRATYKPWVDTLAVRNQIYLGQILSATDFKQFLDQNNNYSRLKQYQIENFLEAIDNGWILQKALFYRGAFQDEDENDWGQRFLNWMLRDAALIKKNYFLVKQSVKAIPHQSENSNIQKVRALSKEIADSMPEFMNQRVKIHGQPDASDVQMVSEFKKRFAAKATPTIQKKIDVLLAELVVLHKPADWQELSVFVKSLGPKTAEGIRVQTTIDQLKAAVEPAQKVKIASELLLHIRQTIAEAPEKSRLTLLDCANKTETLLFNEIPNWQTPTLWHLLDKNYSLALTAAATGYIELWEWEKIQNKLLPPNAESISLSELDGFMVQARRVVEWSTGTIRAVYGAEMKLFEAFEPKSAGFSDDIIRSSVLLYLGDNVGELGKLFYAESQLSNQVFDIANQSHFRGLNPGYAKGELVVADSPEGLEIDATKIYVFQYPPYDLKPVAGIATVTEGNLVSHVQLLARNLGIPNAVLSQTNLEDLKKWNGKHVFYAVSNKGTVTLKKAEEMNAEEKALFQVKKRAEEKIRVPIERMDLTQQLSLNLREVNAKSSGIVCGPKAANLGQLKLMFPEKVVEGIVIPFGVFRQHMEQMMPSGNETYWAFLTKTFQQATAMEKAGKSSKEIETFTLKSLEELRAAILKMDLLPAFKVHFLRQFETVFGKAAGEVPVFLRSDTNMEDLKDFTGAGLNLTLFNVVEKEKILQGILQVWASPYSERSFRWRQSYLLNPESVYPSILIIPSVNVDYSGVLITKGVGIGDDEDLTIAFSRGAGGAVDGQAAESYLLSKNTSDVLLAPAREPSYNMLPASGGTKKAFTSFDSPILNQKNLNEIRSFASGLQLKMNETRGMIGPYDVEFGFLNDKLWLFQVRPFVENRNATGSAYLESITPKINANKRIPLNKNIK